MVISFESILNIIFIFGIFLSFVLFIVFLVLYYDNNQTTKSLKVDLICTSSRHIPFFNLYKDYRKIRHDFANYVQSIQLLQDDASKQERKNNKKDILAQINTLEQNIDKYVNPAKEDCI